jgi:hypothetical protein
MPGCSWIAYEEADITGKLAGNSYGDNWDWHQWDSVAAIEQCYGPDREDWPEKLREAVDSGMMPIVETSRNGIMCCESVGDADKLDFAIDYIGHDFYALDILESRAEAEKFLARAGHNVPLRAIRDDMEALNWIDADEASEGDDE